jgi:DNA-binding response OmpR family regulator
MAQILIVDDDQTISQMLTMLVEQLGHRADCSALIRGRDETGVDRGL